MQLRESLQFFGPREIPKILRGIDSWIAYCFVFLLWLNFIAGGGFGIQVRFHQCKWAITVTNHRCHTMKCNLNDQGKPFVRNQKIVPSVTLLEILHEHVLYLVLARFLLVVTGMELWRISKHTPPPPSNFCTQNIYCMSFMPLLFIRLTWFTSLHLMVTSHHALSRLRLYINKLCS